MEIHVIRHTRLIDGLNKCYGQSDVPVADSFKADAAEIKSYYSQLTMQYFVAH